MALSHVRDWVLLGIISSEVRLVDHHSHCTVMVTIRSTAHSVTKEYELECCTGLVFQFRSRLLPQAAVPLPSRSRKARSHPVPVNIFPVPILIPRSVAEHIHVFFLTRLLCYSG